MFVLRNMVLKRYLAYRTFRKCQPHSDESCATYTYKIEADNQLHYCVCGVLSIKDGDVVNMEWDSSAMDVSAVEVSAMKCEMCFPLECHQSAKVCTAVVWEICKPEA